MPDTTAATEKTNENLNETRSADSNVYLVCTKSEDGSYTFNGREFDFTSRDIWSDGSTTLHLTSGSQFTIAGPTDPLVSALYITEMCPPPVNPTWGM
jgi:hypothetical protein